METLNIVCSECSSVNNVIIEVEGSEIPCKNCKEDLDNPFPVEVTDDSCATYISKGDIPLIVDFYSTTCGPCMAMYEDYEDAALGFGLKVHFLKINADKYQNIAAEYGVSGLPTLIAFKGTKEINRVSRQLSQTELVAWAQSLL